MATARKTRKDKASADLRAVSVASASGLPLVVSDTPAPVLAGSRVVVVDRAPGTGSPAAGDNDGRGHGGAGCEGGDTKRAGASARSSEEGEGGPEEGRGGSPTCRVPSPERGSFAQSIPQSEIPPISSENIPPASDEYTPSLAECIPSFAEQYPAYDESQDKEIDLPPPGSTIKKLMVPKWVGRNPDGSIIPHTRNPEIAKQITEWVALGAQVEEMAIRLNLRPGQIRHIYAYELQTGEFINHMEVGGAILKMAKETPQMAIFYAKARMGWRDGDKANDKEQPGLNITIHT